MSRPFVNISELKIDRKKHVFCFLFDYTRILELLKN